MAGFDGVEMVLGPSLFKAAPRDIVAQAASYDLAIHSVHQTLFAIGPWRAPDRQIGSAVERALALGSSCVVLHVPHAPNWDSALAQSWREALFRWRDSVGERSLRISLEGPDPHWGDGQFSLMDDLHDLDLFAREHALAITLDTTHVGAAGLDLMDSYRAVRDRLVNVHISDSYLDSPWRQGGIFRPAFADHQMLGRGDLALDDFLALLAASKYQGLLTLEVSPFALRSWHPLERAERLEEALRFIRRGLQEKVRR